GDLVNVRHSGDHATPTGVFAIGLRMYGIQPNPGGLHYAYHQLTCGDWWDEDPYSAQYNEFVHVPCGTTPSFASWSEALWTETRAYPYFAVLETNNDPTVGGANAPGAGIFLHHWMNAPTEGCVALPLADLLKVLRWLHPAEHPVIEIGTDADVGVVVTRPADPVVRRPPAARAVRPRPRPRRTRAGGLSLVAGGSLAALGVAVALCVALALRAGRARGAEDGASPHG
ncbi:MAG TPA: L,D-transpeptidase family protein, partial [Solirubrobacteraceae bacterium]